MILAAHVDSTGGRREAGCILVLTRLARAGEGVGHEDLVGEGHVGHRAYRFCAWGGVPERKLVVLEDHSRGAESPKLGTVLEYVAPGGHETLSDEEMFIWTDAFFEYIWEKAGVIHYWRDGKFQLMATSD